METCLLVVTLFLYCICLASNYPSKPLNERSPGITWEAWLLIDDQNQSKQILNSVGPLGKRVTPKSIFIAPNFNPEYLPACAEKCNSDGTGRCIKIIKLDQDAHYEFLIERLKEKFNPDDYEDYDDEEFTSTPGPMQVNIPLHINGGGIETDENMEDTEIAIILSPTKTHFDSNILNLDKRNSIYDGYERQSQRNKEHSTMKEKNELISSMSTEEISKSHEENITRFEKPLTDSSLDQSNQEVKDEDSSMLENLDLKFEVTTHSGETVVTTTRKPLTIKGTIESRFSASTSKTDIPPYVSDSEWKFLNKINLLLPHKHVRVAERDNPFRSEIPSLMNHIPISHRSDIDVNQEDSGQSSDHEVFSEEITSRSDKHIPVKMTHRIFPRKNDDKFKGLFPQKWVHSKFQKPLLLTFSRSSININLDQFKNQEYYRLVPTNDLAYLFDFKHSQPSQK